MSYSKIDVHTHILPRDIPKFKDKYGYGGFVALEHTGACTAHMVKDDGTFFRKVESNCWDPSPRLKDCDEHGVHIQVLSTVPVMFSYWTKPQDGLDLSRFLNDHIAEMVNKHPKRFVGLGTLPMQAPKLAIKELERCMKELNMAGVQIGTHVEGRNLDDKELFPIFEAAQDLGAAIFVHPWDMLGGDRTKKYWMPWLVGMPTEVTIAICSMIFGGVFERLPKLRVAFAHGGGSFGGTLGRIEHGFHARPDLCATENKKSPKSYLGKFYVDTLVHDPRKLKYLIDLFGAKKMMLGTDYPFPLGENKPGELIHSLEIDDESKKWLFSESAKTWLNI